MQNPGAYVGFREIECPNSNCQHFKQSQAPKLRASARAEQASQRAGSWHQGSGTHATSCQSLAEHFEKIAATDPTNTDRYLAVADLWADAAEAEAQDLEQRQGDYIDDTEEWQKTRSGQTTAKAVTASEELDPDFRLQDWL